MTAATSRRQRRWLRFAIPFAVLFALWTGTAVAHAIEEPDLDEPGTLSPLGTGPDGSSRLADMLRARGVRIIRVTSSAAAVAEAARADSTIFAPTPDLLRTGFLTQFDQAAQSHRVVVVQPGLRTWIGSPAPIFRVHDRWATKTTSPSCHTDYAVSAGPAAAYNEAYETEGPASVSCYQGGVVGAQRGDTEIIYVGASDPFRNGRIDEGGNASLATGLLTGYARVIWLDVHDREPDGQPDLELPKLPDYHRGERGRAGADGPGLGAFPPALLAALALTLAAGVLFAVARARRIGTPVPEPLPVLVPAAETVTGRGRLYERIAARSATIDALRAAAITRLARLINPFGGPAPERDLLGRDGQPPPAAETFVAQVALRARMPDHVVRAILYGPIADDDDSLARAVADLDDLVAAVLREKPSQGGKL